MKNAKFAVIYAFIFTFLLSVSACSNQNNDIKTLTSRFENSCNELNLNAMLECIDPDVSDSVKTLTGIIGMFSDDDTSELLDKFAKVVFSELPENSKEFFSSIKIDLNNIKIDENKAFALADITYNISEETKKVNATFDYICIDEIWYISNLDVE